jgi:hypothetical protein
MRHDEGSLANPPHFGIAPSEDLGDLRLQLNGIPDWYFGRKDCKGFAEWRLSQG